MIEIKARGSFFEQYEEKKNDTILTQISFYLEKLLYLLISIGPYLFLYTFFSYESVQPVKFGYSVYSPGRLWILFVKCPAALLWMGTGFYFFCSQRNWKIFLAPYFGTLALIMTYGLLFS